MDYIGYIYRTKNLVNNKIYIGQHKSKINKSGWIFYFKEDYDKIL